VVPQGTRHAIAVTVPGWHTACPGESGRTPDVEEGRAESVSALIAEGLAVLEARSHAVLTSDDADIAKVNRDLILVHV
jgi:hypothetical protein